jgi:hypothetical protein
MSDNTISLLYRDLERHIFNILRKNPDLELRLNDAVIQDFFIKNNIDSQLVNLEELQIRVFRMLETLNMIEKFDRKRPEVYTYFKLHPRWKEKILPFDRG